MRNTLLAVLVAGTAFLTAIPVYAASIDADVTVRSGHDDGDIWKRRTVRHDRGFHRGWRDDRPRGYTVRRIHRPAVGLASDCRTVIKRIWRDGDRVTIKRRVCD